MRASFAAMTAVVVAIGAAGCSQRESVQSDAGTASVVASTDVWGSVASAVTGDHASVTSIVNGTVADPHSFEASPADTATLTDASLVVFNGGDYDHWVEHVLEEHPDVPSVSGYSAYALLPPSSQPPNEHVFYDPATAKAVAAQIAERLSTIDSANADAYRANAATFGAKADEILTLERAIGQEHPGPPSSRPSPSHTTCWSMPVSPTRLQRASPTRSRRTPTRPPRTWPRCST